MESINTKNFTKEINAVVNAIGIDLEAVEIVPSIYDWCIENNIEESNYFRTGKCLINTATGKYLILLSEEIRLEEISSIITLMEIKGLSQKTGRLNSSWAFLKHLLLHEISHAINPSFTEIQCDIWAFEQMDKIPI